jgi:transposase-like protein
MPKRNYTPEQIINSLREAEVLLSKGSTTAEAARHLGISEQTYYKWRKEYGGMRINQAKRLKELEKENARLKKLVADQAL